MGFRRAGGDPGDLPNAIGDVLAHDGRRPRRVTRRRNCDRAITVEQIKGLQPMGASSRDDAAVHEVLDWKANLLPR